MIDIQILSSIGRAEIIVSELTISDSIIYIKENGSNSGSFNVQLSKPANITINLASRNSYTNLDKSQLTFTLVNYSTPQTVTVTGQVNAESGVKYDYIDITATGLTDQELEVRVVDSTIDSSIYNTEPLSLLNWSVENDLNTLKQSTIDWIFGSGYGNGDGSLPSALPQNIQAHSNDTYATGANITGLQGIDVMDVPLGGTWNVKVYHFKPNTPNGDWFITPTGHGDNWTGTGITNGYELLIDNLIQSGYNVLFYYMVGRGPNATGDGITQGTGGVGGTHDDMATLESSNPYFNPTEYFLTSSFVAVNYAENQGAANVYMTGISGGGWTTTWVLALDQRVTKGFNVAGNYPIFIREAYDTTSDDYEQGYNAAGDTARTTQFLIDQYARVGYMDLYCMGAQGRAHYQFNNINDSCCFDGYYNTVYKTELQKKLGSIGTFEAFTYDQPGEHTYNQTIITQILNLI